MENERKSFAFISGFGKCVKMCDNLTKKKGMCKLRVVCGDDTNKKTKRGAFMNLVRHANKWLITLVSILVCACIGSVIYANSSSEEGWHGTKEERYYIKDNEKVIGWLKLDDATYYLNKKGNPVTGWLELDEGRYYFKKSGKMVTGEQEVDGETYNFQKDGRLLQGWQEDHTMYYNNYGYAQTGWQEIDGQKYYFNEEGVALLGWQELDGSKYYFKEDGSMAVGEVDIDGTTYTFQENGTIIVGWHWYQGEKYYYTETGVYLTGWQDIDGNKYYFNEKGMMYGDREFEGYSFDSYGVATKITEQKKATTNYNYEAVNIAADGNIANAALAQVGRKQDCTWLVSNALAAAGIYYHGWPAGYMSLGTIVSASEAQPGDVIYYADAGVGVPHVAVYIGGGRAVHGGWQGNNTVVASAFVGTGPVFIRVH